MSTPERGTFIEGVGDELIHALGLLIVVAVPLLVAYHNRQNRGDAIHPDNVARVQRALSGRGFRVPNNERETHAGATSNGQSAAENSGVPQAGPSRRYNVDPTCPICLQEKECAAETNCGHVFCGNCVIAYWRHGSWLGAINCPVCRQIVTIILPLYTDEEQNSDEGRRVSAEIRDYNRRFSGEPRPIMDYIYDLPTLLRHAAREFFTPHGFVWMFRLRIVVCFLAVLLYLISPLDIIPEAVFGILGFVDDIIVVLIMAVYVTILYRNIVAERIRAEG